MGPRLADAARSHHPRGRSRPARLGLPDPALGSIACPEPDASTARRLRAIWTKRASNARQCRLHCRERAARPRAKRPVVHHIPICPFCQRLEILLELKGRQKDVAFEVVDITKPRSERLLRLTRGKTALPVLELEGGRVLTESLVLMDYLEETFDDKPIRRADPYERAIERLLVRREAGLVQAGYALVMNQERARRQALVERYLGELEALDAQLREHSPGRSAFVFDDFGWVEAVFTPFFQRFAFVAYYEGVDVPEEARFDRVRAWRDACVAHPSAQQTSAEEIVKLYYDYARNAGNGSLPPGRQRSSFSFEPHWRDRPMPPKDKYGPGASDEALGLC